MTGFECLLTQYLDNKISGRKEMLVLTFSFINQNGRYANLGVFRIFVYINIHIFPVADGEKSMKAVHKTSYSLLANCSVNNYYWFWTRGQALTT